MNAGELQAAPIPSAEREVEERDFTEDTVFYDNDPAAAQARTRASLWTLHALLLLALAHASRHGGGGGARFYVVGAGAGF
ncbi:MAG: hypothetical protein H0W66_07250 [Chthoniobacterales bacterium]|nr:hypothetical protein [Chthoniobacterales bacterium]